MEQHSLGCQRVKEQSGGFFGKSRRLIVGREFGTEPLKKLIVIVKSKKNGLVAAVRGDFSIAVECGEPYDPGGRFCLDPYECFR